LSGRKREEIGGCAESDMGVAVTAWNQELRDQALPNYRAAVARRSAWGNQQWVTALYGPQVGATTQAIHTQLVRRKKAEPSAKRCSQIGSALRGILNYCFHCKTVKRITALVQS
jgi:hypothetical protein